MSDATLEKIIHYGTNAERLAFTPSPAAAIKLLYFWYETDTGALYLYDTTWHVVTASTAAISTIPSTFEHRLTLETGVPVSTTDQTAKTTVYLTPFRGQSMALFNGTSWVYYTVPEIAILLGTLTSGKNYDLFVFASTATPSSTNTTTDIVTFGSATGWNTGARVIPASTIGGLTSGTVYYWNAASSTTGSFHTTLANAIAGSSKVDLTASITQSLTAVSLEMSAAWTNDTTRADALTTQDSIDVKSGSLTRRYVGTFRTTSTTTTEDSGGITGTTQVGGKRFVWSAYNQVPRDLKVIDTTDTWSYTTDTVRQANAAAGNKVEWVTGKADMQVSAKVLANGHINSPTVNAKAGVGIDSTTAFSGLVSGRGGPVAANSAVVPLTGFYRGQPGLGYHYAAWLEKGGSSTSVFYGDTGGDGQQSGLIAVIVG